MIRLAKESELCEIMNVFAKAKAYMRKSGNLNQWTGTYPDESLLTDDIRKGNLYAMVDDETDKIYGVFALISGDDPTYGYIEGAWHYNTPYATLHRVASDGTHKGVFKECTEFALERYCHLRVDTHEDNKTMQHVIEKCGFAYAGVIYLENGAPRVAFDRLEN